MVLRNYIFLIKLGRRKSDGMGRKTQKTVVCLGLLLLLFAAAGPFASRIQSSGMDDPSHKPDKKTVKAVTSWLKQNAVQLDSVEAGHGFADLLPLKNIFKDVRIVSLGETTHGTREFFQFKHRMLEFLVKEMNFTVFAIEASYSACMNINDYVLYGRGDPAEALAGQGFWTWDTEEVRVMMEWMRNYNKSVPDKKRIRFYGYDIQYLDQAFDVVLNYVSRTSPELFDKVKAVLQPIHKERQKMSELAQLAAGEIAHYKKQLYELIGHFAFNETRFVRETSLHDYKNALQHARLLYQLLDMRSREGYTPYVEEIPAPRDSMGAIDSSIGRRDLYMAENIAYFLETEGPGTRIVVWAHNTHIAVKDHTYIGWRNDTPMGAHLRRIFGDEYYSLGFLFNQGSFQCREMNRDDPQYGALHEFTIGPAKPGSAEWYFSKLGKDLFVIDFRAVPQNSTVSKWLNSYHPMVNIGGGFSYSWEPYFYIVPSILTDHFDGIAYFEQTTRARPNPTGMVGPSKK